MLKTRKKVSDEYRATSAPRLVEVPTTKYLSITGRGAPGGPAFTDAMNALYAVAYTIKMARKKVGTQFKIAKLEGLWWGDHPGAVVPDSPEEWNWQLLIRVPEAVTNGEVAAAAKLLRERGKSAMVDSVVIAELEEGQCVQAMHIGPYANEKETIKRMQAYAADKGMKFSGRHHEIYIGDPRRAAPERLRTILRMPVAQN
ncbi:MAG TPA: GyrI-like domain-containing protein [Gemmatimonadaceae bacterium]|nr:GyrI-like domain-containing protein [Gemmatimonadaceae bacterium]